MSLLLIVDDNEVHCYAMSRMLQAAGYETLTAHTGSDAIGVMSGIAVELVLLDINLPDMNGIEVCRRIKARPSTADIPVVFHSATHGSDEWRRRAEAVGASDFLTYPVAREHLLLVIRGVLDKAAAGRGRAKRRRKRVYRMES